jgi:hypothetical protein
MAEFMQQGATRKSEMYCETLKKNCVGPAIQNKRRGMLTYSVVLSHDNARPHTVARIRALLEHFNISTGSCLITFLTLPISLRATTTRFSTWRTDWDHSSSTE